MTPRPAPLAAGDVARRPGRPAAPDDGTRRRRWWSTALPPVHDRRFWITQALVVMVSVSHGILHLEAAGYPDVLVVIAYAFPVLYAALEFGLRGSVATTAFVVVLTMPYVVHDAIAGSHTDFVGHVLELGILSIVAPVVGRVVEAERQARLDHEAAEQRYRALFATSGVPAVVLDGTGRIQEANPAAADVLPGPLEGRLLEDLLGAETTRALLAEERVVPVQVSAGVELRPVVSRTEGADGERLTQVIFQDVTEEASEHRRARAWGLAVLGAQEEERRRIARDLHDEAVQLVVELRRRVERASRRAPAAGDELTEATALADQVIGELRTVAVRLRPPDLDDLGLVASLDRLVGEARRRGTAAELDVTGDGAIRSPLALALYRVGQEALTNAERHAGASRIELALDIATDTVTLRVTDDGIGFIAGDDGEARDEDDDGDDGPDGRDGQGGRVHLGLVGMRERMQLVGGDLTVGSAPGAGTTIVATAPR